MFCNCEKNFDPAVKTSKRGMSQYSTKSVIEIGGHGGSLEWKSSVLLEFKLSTSKNKPSLHKLASYVC